MPEPVLDIVGVGADGWEGLTEPLRDLLCEAEIVVGGQRHLGMLPDHVRGERVPWPTPLLEGLSAMVGQWSGRRVVALASGDPYVSGIGTTLGRAMGPDRIRVHPAVSSVALARARMGWPAETVTVLRDYRELPRHLTEGNRIVLLSADAATPARVSILLQTCAAGRSKVVALAHLGGPGEVRIEAVAANWDHQVPDLHLLAIEVALDPSAVALGWSAGLPDEVFEHDGQITKRDLRASALARLSPAPGELLWDVGAGAGSVGIEWMRAHSRCRAIAIEARPDRAARIARNALRLGVPSLEVVSSDAPGALPNLPVPDAVFVGGGATREGVLEIAWQRLRTGGRLVVHAVTLETEQVVLDWARRLGGELTRIGVETAKPIGAFTGWTPARAVVQWSITKQEGER